MQDLNRDFANICISSICTLNLRLPSSRLLQSVSLLWKIAGTSGYLEIIDVNASLIRRDAKMIHPQPGFRETRCQELRNLLFSPSPLFHSQLSKEGEECIFNKALLSSLRDSGTIKTSLFVTPPPITEKATIENTLW